MNNLWKTIHLRIDSYSLMNKNIHHYGVIDMCMNRGIFVMANSNHNDTVLSYDELGFIIGMKRVEKKVSTIDSNIEKIIGILTQSFEEQKAQFAQPQPKLTEFQKMLNAVNNRQALDFEDLLKDKANPITQSFVVADKLVKDFADVLDQSINDLKTVDKKQINKSNGRKPAIEINSHDDLSKIVNPSVPERTCYLLID